MGNRIKKGTIQEFLFAWIYSQAVKMIHLQTGWSKNTVREVMSGKSKNVEVAAALRKQLTEQRVNVVPFTQTIQKIDELLARLPEPVQSKKVNKRKK